jgi:hypothetical protein
VAGNFLKSVLTECGRWPHSRTRTHGLVFGAGLVCAFAIPLQAQVEKAAMRTTGISCGACAVFSEVYLRRLPEIDKINISLSKEAVMVTYKPGAAFRPGELREALRKTEVGITQLQISARGLVQRQSGRQVLIAGKDKFVLTDKQNRSIPMNTPVLVEGVVNDKADPMELNVLTVVPAPPHTQN